VISNQNHQLTDLKSLKSIEAMTSVVLITFTILWAILL